MQTFCERIPLQTYDDIKPYVTRMINGEEISFGLRSLTMVRKKQRHHKRQKQDSFPSHPKF